MKKITGIIAGIALGAVMLTGCSDSDTVSENLSKEADDFKVYRQVVLYNGITDKPILSEEGYCSQGNDSTKDKVIIICKVGKKYIKNIYNMSDNTIVFINQLEASKSSTHGHKVVIHPNFPDIEVK